MPIIKELWNNISSPCKNWHKLNKWFNILFKSKQMSEIKNRKRNNRRSLPGLLHVRPSQLAGPASQPSPPPSSSSWRQSARRVAGARARPERHATSSSACLPRQRDAATLLLGAAPIPWPYPPSLPCCSLSLSHGRTQIGRASCRERV